MIWLANLISLVTVASKSKPIRETGSATKGRQVKAAEQGNSNCTGHRFFPRFG